jgi:hypothetical protein
MAGERKEGGADKAPVPDVSGGGSEYGGSGWYGTGHYGSSGDEGWRGDLERKDDRSTDAPVGDASTGATAPREEPVEIHPTIGPEKDR